ncbi:cytochrome c peroxidase [Pseudotenacibaculum sp. MALMAid0570]|uniref:cytochrome-c peroxidase n=1 Tax=Pseudotenacibaculum sp. MALMAid0570 TaxID=3143938 RepID=UPI0032DE832E
MRTIKNTLLLVLAISLFACNNDDYVDITTDGDITNDDGNGDTSDDDILAQTLNLPATSFNYANIQMPGHFLDNQLQNEDNTPNNNPITDAGATLGRVLFYDKKLSANNTVSCASCHVQENGFSDPNTLSIGFEGELTGRNSMGLSNAKFYNNGRFFWDERAATLEDQVLMPIQDAVEMGLTLEELVDKVSAEGYYRILFDRAFGDENITSERISLALAQFVRSMVSYESKFDAGMAQVGNPQQNFPNFTPSENLGKNLFFSNRTRCNDCHDTNAMVGDAPRNNGLDAVLTDLGVGGVTGNNNDRGEFKVGSLRNIELTGPYMHDGRFATLGEVIDHYDDGVQNSQDLDNRLRVGGNQVRRLNLTPAERQGLIDFLLTLTDTNFITDEKYSDPFRTN